MEITTFWCEYDIGINERVFKDEDVARSHVRQALRDCGLKESLEELEEDVLVGFETQEVIVDGPT